MRQFARVLNAIMVAYGINILGALLMGFGAFGATDRVEKAIMVSIGILVMALGLAVNRLSPPELPESDLAPSASWSTLPTPDDDVDIYGDGLDADDDDWDDLEDLDSGEVAR